jgi:hypothetical protein
LTFFALPEAAEAEVVHLRKLTLAEVALEDIEHLIAPTLREAVVQQNQI